MTLPHKSRALMFIGAVLLQGCTILPVTPTTTTFMAHKDAPPKIEVTDFDFGSMTDRHGLFYWVEEPQWDEPTSNRQDNGRYLSTRVTTNRPMIRVYVDSTLLGTECRWFALRLKQELTSGHADDFDFGDGVIIDEDDMGTDQMKADPAQVKAMIKDDSRYESILKKD